MIKVKQVLYFSSTNSIEATWADENDAQVRCHSYDQTQMNMLEADLGADAPAYANLIATVLANTIPPPAADPAVLAAEKQAVLAEFRALRDTALSRLNGIQMDATLQSEIDAIKVAKQGLKDMPQHASVVAAVGGDATEDALQALYSAVSLQLYQSAPAAYTAFRGLDL